MAVDLLVVQGTQSVLKGHGLGVAPLAFPVVEHRRLHPVGPAGSHRGHPVHGLQQLAKVPVLGIAALGVEVGRAVRVGEGVPGKGVGHKVVDAPHQKVVRQVLLQPDALLPSVVAENLAHGVACLARLKCRGAGRQGAQAVVVELPVAGAALGVQGGAVLPLGQHLAADVVDARHVLALEPPEEVPQAGAGAAVLAVVLDDVADVRHPPLMAPVRHLLAEVLPHQLCHQIHVGRVEPGRFLAAVLGEQPGQLLPPAWAPAFLQGGFQLPAPGQILAAAQGVALGVGGAVAQVGLVGEEPGQGLAKLLGIALPVGLVHSLQQQADACLVQHVDVIPVEARIPAGSHHLELPGPGGLVPAQLLPLEEGGEVQNCPVLHRLHREHSVPGWVKPPGRLPGEEALADVLLGGARAFQQAGLAQREGHGSGFLPQGQPVAEDVLPA